jgi:choline dehydrogenase-like flavoprotein
MTKQAHSVILGAGPMGRAIAETLAAKGESVTVITRDGRTIGAGIGSAQADLSNAEQTIAACAGADAIYHCAAPPYHKWVCGISGPAGGSGCCRRGNRCRACRHRESLWLWRRRNHDRGYAAERDNPQRRATGAVIARASGGACVRPRQVCGGSGDGLLRPQRAGLCVGEPVLAAALGRQARRLGR